MPNGKICYVEIPSTDAAASARFYEAVFGWKARRRGDGAHAFDDIDAALLLVTANGGAVHTQRTEVSPAGDAYALFVDIAGNVFGMYQGPQ